MLDKDPCKRIGQKNGIEEVKQHEFCLDIQWGEIYDKKLEAPIKVDFSKSNFDEEYTKMKIDLKEEEENLIEI